MFAEPPVAPKTTLFIEECPSYCLKQNEFKRNEFEPSRSVAGLKSSLAGGRELCSCPHLQVSHPDAAAATCS